MLAKETSFPREELLITMPDRSFIAAIRKKALEIIRGEKAGGVKVSAELL